MVPVPRRADRRLRRHPDRRLAHRLHGRARLRGLVPSRPTVRRCGTRSGRPASRTASSRSGLEALDILRIESGLIFAGYEFDDQVDPFEAGIGFTVALSSEEDFIGRDALIERKAHPQRTLVGPRARRQRGPPATATRCTSAAGGSASSRAACAARRCARRSRCAGWRCSTRRSEPRSRSASSTASRSGSRRGSCASRSTTRRRRGRAREPASRHRTTDPGGHADERHRADAAAEAARRPGTPRKGERNAGAAAADRRRAAHAQGGRRRGGGQGHAAGHGPLRHRRDGRDDDRAGHDPRDDRQRLPVGVAAPAARARLARPLPDERDAAEDRALRHQRARARPGPLRGPFRRPAARRRSIRSSSGRKGCRCSTARSRTSPAGSSMPTGPATTCCGSARSSISTTATASRCCSTPAGSGPSARPASE